MSRSFKFLIVLIIIVILIALLKPFYIVSEGEQAVVVRFGRIVKTETTAGLKFKTPMVDQVRKYSKKILAWDGDPQRVPTSEKQYLLVDATARWKIVNPAKFYETITTMEQAYAKLDDIIDSSVRTVIAKNSLVEAVRNSNIINEIEKSAESTNVEISKALEALLSNDVDYIEVKSGRSALSDEMLRIASVDLEAQLGIQLLDVVIRQISYSDDLTQSVYNRMIKERNQIAQAYRSYGEGQKAELMGQLDKEKVTILSQAYNKAESTKGEGDAEAARIYAETFGEDPEFYSFWKLMESYKTNLGQINKTLTTDLDYFKYLHSVTGE